MPHYRNNHLHQEFHQEIPWADPLSFLSCLPTGTEDCWVLLYSGMRTPYSGRYSFLALRPSRSVQAESFEMLEQAMAENTAPCANPSRRWFGYFGYGLKNSLETLTCDAPSPYFSLPSLWMMQYRLVLVFDHEKCRLDAWAETAEDLVFIPAPITASPHINVQLEEISSNMTTAEYRQHVITIQQAITAGDVYQANLTRKFFGTLTPGYSATNLFQQLCTISPSPYSALLKLGECYILSSSPEQFLSLDPEGNIAARPIKGSAPRYSDEAQDQQSKSDLANSEKNRAENLMIVDLMRNDLARSCQAGSVKVTDLFELRSYATIHHLSSTILGKRRQDMSPVHLIKQCFPPGSMTGTPKIQAMELCSRLEKQERGIYAGCIGWMGGDNAGEFSVVIRTLLLRGNRFEFQVGGAIIADSNPEEELQETLNKATALAAILSIPLSVLAGL